MIRKSAFFLDETEQMIIPLQVPSHPTPFFLRYRVSYFYISPNRVFEHPTAKAVGFFAFAISLGILLRIYFNWEERKFPHKRRTSIFAFAMCFFYAYCSEKFFGIASITGAYVAGIMISGLDDTPFVDRKAVVSGYMIFTPIFFAYIGISADFSSFSLNALWFGLAFVALGIAGKIIGCSLAAKPFLSFIDVDDRLFESAGDLPGRVLEYCEKTGQPVTENLVKQYLQSPEIAADYAAYYELYNLYYRQFRIEEILAGNAVAPERDFRSAPFDEKLSLIGLLTDRLNRDFRTFCIDEDVQKSLFGELKLLLKTEHADVSALRARLQESLEDAGKETKDTPEPEPEQEEQQEPDKTTNRRKR